MSLLVSTAPEVLAGASHDLSRIGSAVSVANVLAAKSRPQSVAAGRNELWPPAIAAHRQERPMNLLSLFNYGIYSTMHVRSLVF